MARLARVPATTLRAWERAGLLQPTRSAAGYRVYGRRDVERIKFLKDQLSTSGRLGVHALATAQAREPQVVAPGLGVPLDEEPTPASVGAFASASPPADPTGVTRAAQDALAWAHPHMRARWSAIALPRPGDRRLTVLATVGQPALMGQVLGANAASEWERHLADDHSGTLAAPALGDAASTCAFPLVVHGVTGALIAPYDVDFGAMRACVGAIEVILQQASAASHASGQFRRWQRESVALHAIVHALSANPDRDAVLQVALEHILRVLEVECGTIHVVDRASQQFLLAAHEGCSPEYVAGLAGWPLTEGIGGRAFSSQEALVVSGLSADPRITRDAVRHERLHAWACVPLLHQREAYGLIEVMSMDDHQFAAADTEFLRLVADHLAVVVARAELTAQLAEASLERARLLRGWARNLEEERQARVDDLMPVLEAAVAAPLREAGCAAADLRRAADSALTGVELVREQISDQSDDGAILRTLVEDGLIPMAAAVPGELRVDVTRWPDRLSTRALARLYELIRLLVLDALRDRGADLVELAINTRERCYDVAVCARWDALRAVVDDWARIRAEVEPRVAALGGRVEYGSGPGVEEVRLVLPQTDKPEVDTLTERQVAVMRAMARGLTRRQIAEELGIGEKTVQNHLTAAYGRLGAHNRAQAIMVALRIGVLGREEVLSPDASFIEP